MESNLGTSNFATKLIDLVNQKYPDWENFSDPRLDRDEVEYKRAASTKARGLLDKADLERLIHVEKNYDEVIRRIEKAAQGNNLLYLGTPKTSDIGILFNENLDKPSFCQAFFRLIYGEGSSPERLARYAAFVEKEHLPNKWTFPTYY